MLLMFITFHRSADDLIILRMALEFGPETSLVTNDRYRDHRLGICDRDVELGKIWDDFMTDAVYRHDKETIEVNQLFFLDEILAFTAPS